MSANKKNNNRIIPSSEMKTKIKLIIKISLKVSSRRKRGLHTRFALR